MSGSARLVRSVGVPNVDRRRLGALVLDVAGMVLLAAATLKLVHVYDGRGVAVAVPVGDWAEAAAEALLAAFILSGSRPWVARAMTIGTFAIFATVTGWEFLHGKPDCGCFGDVRVNPLWTLGLDLAVLLGLVAVDVPAERASVWRRPGGWIGAAIIVALSLTHPRTMREIAGMQGQPVALLSADQTAGALRAGNAGFWELRRERWIGKAFPLRPLIADGEALDRGTWLVVLYSPGCVHCQQAIPVIEQFAASTAARANHRRVALIAIPPVDASIPDPAERATHCSVFHLPPDARLAVGIPCPIQLTDGIVTSDEWPVPVP